MNVNMSEDKWIRVLNTLSEKPYREVSDLIAELTQQLAAQKQAAQKAAAE